MGIYGDVATAAGVNMAKVSRSRSSNGNAWCCKLNLFSIFTQNNCFSIRFGCRRLPWFVGSVRLFIYSHFAFNLQQIKWPIKAIKLNNQWASMRRSADNGEENGRKRSLKCVSQAVRWAGPRYVMFVQRTNESLSTTLCEKGQQRRARKNLHLNESIIAWTPISKSVHILLAIIAFGCVNIRPPNDDQPSIIHVKRQSVFPSWTKSENKFKFIRMANRAAKTRLNIFQRWQPFAVVLSSRLKH